MASHFIDGAAFKRARERFGFSQVRAGEICGVHETTVQRWERGATKRVRRVYLDRMREAFERERGA